jgi:hypothetical protein
MCHHLMKSRSQRHYKITYFKVLPCSIAVRYVANLSSTLEHRSALGEAGAGTRSAANSRPHPAIHSSKGNFRTQVTSATETVLPNSQSTYTTAIIMKCSLVGLLSMRHIGSDRFRMGFLRTSTHLGIIF